MNRSARVLQAPVPAAGLVVLVVLVVLLAAGPARAETAETRRPSPVYSSPGEQARVVTRVRAGSALKVLERKNRWLKVRVNGRTGWIARTSVAPLARGDAPGRSARRRASAQGRGRRPGTPGTAARDRAGDHASDDGAAARPEQAGPEEAGDQNVLRARRRQAVLRRLVERRALAAERATAIAIDGTAGEGEDLPLAGTGAGRGVARADRGVDSDAGADLAAGAGDVHLPGATPVASLAPPAADAAGRAGARAEVARAPEYVVVRAEARLYQQPTSRSDQVLRASAGVRLRVLERTGKWLRVASERGEAGWVRSSRVRQSPVDDRRRDARRLDAGRGDAGRVDDAAPAARPAAAASASRGDKLVVRATAALGYTAIGQKFASGSSDPRATYRLSSGAAVLGAGGELIHAWSARWVVAGDLGYRYSQATPGLHYTDPDTMTAVDIGFKRHQIDLGARAGYALGGAPGMVAYARVGFRYDNLRIDDVRNFDSNLARLPSEVLRGVTVGALLDVPRLGARWSARVGLDALPLLASRTQTTGLEDGASSHTFAVRGAAIVACALGDTYRVSGEYGVEYAKTRWSGVADGSMRLQAADWARRKDSAHMFVIGVGRSF